MILLPRGKVHLQTSCVLRLPPSCPLLDSQIQARRDELRSRCSGLFCTPKFMFGYAQHASECSSGHGSDGCCRAYLLQHQVIIRLSAGSEPVTMWGCAVIADPRLMACTQTASVPAHLSYSSIFKFEKLVLVRES